MPPGPREASRRIDKYVDVSASPRSVREVLVDILVGSGWYQGDSAVEKAAEWSARFISALTAHENEARSAGSFVCYTFNSADEDFIQGSCFCEPGDDESVVVAKQRRAFTVPLIGLFDQLTPDEFELLCGGVLRLLGVASPHVTRHSADQGIDFYGRAPFSKIIAPSALPAGVEKDLNVWLVGQAKHYTSVKVSTNELRELVGSTELARSKVFAGIENPLRNLDARICDPVFYMLLTTGRFTGDSRMIIERSGIIAMDGLQIAQFLADHGAGSALTPFSSTALLDWVQANA